MTARAPFISSLRLGFGCSGAVGMGWFPERETRSLIDAALAGGVRHFDTAGFYAGGEAERRLGAALAECREPIFVSTKTGTAYGPGGARKDFSADAIRRDVELSLTRLKRDSLDLVYLHGPDSEQERAGIEALQRLKTEGLVARIGVCGEGEGLQRAAANEAVDALMGAFNFLRRGHAGAFVAAKARGASVVAIAPLAQGLYDDRFFRVRTMADGWRIARALVKNRRELVRARAARAMLSSIDGCTPAQAALEFVLAQDFIDVAITTTTKRAHLQETLKAARRAEGGVPDAIRLLPE